MRNGIVHLWELSNKNIYVKLNKKFRSHFYSHLKELKKSKKLRHLALELGFPYYGFYYMFYTSFINLYTLFRLSYYFNKSGCNFCSKEKLEKNIIDIKSHRRGVSIKNCMFPLNFRSKEGAILISALLHDGGISAKLTPHYRNNKKILRKEVYNAVCKIVGKPGTNACNPSKIMMYFPRLLGLLMVYGLGMKGGDKISNPKIPGFLFHCNKKIKAEFIRHAIDDDGWIDKHSRSVGMELAVDTSISPNTPPCLLLDNKRLIESLDIDVLGPYLKSHYKREDGRETNRWYIIIKGKKNFLKLLKCPPKLDYKRRNLERITNSFVQEQFSRKKCFNIYIQNIKKLQEEGKQINRITLAKKVKRSEKTTLEILKRMKDKGIISVDRVGIGGFVHYPTDYKIAKVVSRPGQDGIVNAIKIEKK
jgi:ribosomal protein S8E